ncbi:dCTP deaminase/dUTPase family protein [Dolosicoccus paucivorans]|uniref:dUTP diphosphatase n=1 Tax=Dolosicoccus paucivorans TaxID=84521 RepID=UPI000881F70F|nr:dUTP diphosphatase [Dolosicoccus paucivorans]SDI38827.1 dUTP pyrophosphatase [Dolosicoccus paucivorans]
MKKRGFEVIKEYENQSINIPQRATIHAAGYDFEAAETIVLPSYWKEVFKYLAKELKQWILKSPQETDEMTDETVKGLLKPTLVPTGIKAYMQDDEYLQLTNRSSNPLKRFLALPNGVGIIDADYYNNPNNEGHIYVQLINFGLFDCIIEKGERIAQGIFLPFLKADGDEGGRLERTGGFGSSKD